MVDRVHVCLGFMLPRLDKGIAAAETVCHVYKKNCKITGVDKKKEYYFRKGRKNIFKDLRKQE